MLLGISLVLGMLIAWLAVTAVFIVTWIYRAMVGLQEEDTLFIDPGEERLLREQSVVVKKIERITPYFYGSLITSVLLGLATFGVWIYMELN